ncbi:MAG: hypothetical protein LBH04_10650 [Tannerellaceae bacterium]|jgi:hypothetical protein|nr:hypothetical protein [Tannerellaceae bacterium]
MIEYIIITAPFFFFSLFPRMALRISLQGECFSRMPWGAGRACRRAAREAEVVFDTYNIMVYDKGLLVLGLS